MKLSLSTLFTFFFLCLVPLIDARGHANLHQLYLQVSQDEHLTSPSALSSVLSSSSIQSAVSSRSADVSPEPPRPQMITEWFDQKLDHFDAQEKRTWKQKFYYSFDLYKPGGPAFIYIGGEAGLSNLSIATGEIADFARQHNGALFGLEHRFYGESQPFSTWDTENLAYLSSVQALSDLAYFLLNRTASVPALNSSIGWVCAGGSYPGALSAWFHLKYPHLTIASLASSAPTHAKAEFYEYDQAVSGSLTDECANAIRQSTHVIETQLNNSQTATALKAQFGCGSIPNDENVGFLYTLADAVAFSVQYSSTQNISRYYHLRENMCKTFLNQTLSKNGTDLITPYIEFFTGLMNRIGQSCEDFSSTVVKPLSNTTISADRNSRQWYYQSCTEFGYFQTAPRVNPLRSPLITLDFHLDLCRKVFSNMALVPATAEINQRYGGQEPVGSRVFFVNGNVDPWRMLSITKPVECCSDLRVLVINGTAHCADFNRYSPDEPHALTEARQIIRQQFAEWIQVKLQDECPNNLTRCDSECVDLSTSLTHCGSCNNSIYNSTSSNTDNLICLRGSIFAIPSSSSSSKFAGGIEVFIVGIITAVIGVVTLLLGLKALKSAAQLKNEDERSGGRGFQPLAS